MLWEPWVQMDGGGEWRNRQENEPVGGRSGFEMWSQPGKQTKIRYTEQRTA